MPLLQAAMVGTVLVRVLTTAGGVVASIITARALGPEGRGFYYYLIMLGGLATQFGTLGQHASNTYFTAKDRSNSANLATNSIWISLVVGVAAAFILPMMADRSRTDPGSNTAFLWVAVYVPSSLLIQLMNGVLVGLGRVRLYNAAQLSLSMLTLLGLCIAGIGSKNVANFVAAFALAHAVIALALVGFFAKQVRLPVRFDRRVFREGLVFSAKSFLVAVLGFLVTRMNVFLLEHTHAGAELGYYSLGMQLFDALSIVPASIALVLFPKLVNNKSAWTDTLRNVGLVVAIMSVGCLAVYAILPFAIRIAFGETFMPAKPVAALLLPAAMFIGITTIFSQFLAAQGLPASVLKAWAVATLVAASSGWLLIPEHGALGAAGALSLTYFIMAVIMGALSYLKARDLSLHRQAPEAV